MLKQTEGPEDQVNELGHGMRILLGSVGSTFVIAAIFWAGATYNRIQAIEIHLTNIDSAVAKIGDLQTVEERTLDIQQRLNRLEEKTK